MTNEEYKHLSIKEFTEAAKRYEGDHAGLYEMCKKDYPDILEELEKEPFIDLLDAGCGPAPMISLLSEKYPDRHYTGLDLTPAMIEEAKKKNITNAVFVVGDCENFPFEENSFDAIICSMSFHHYPNPQAFFNSVKRCLRPKGRLILRDVTSDNKPLVWLMNKIEMPLANLCGHGDVQVPTRDLVYKCCKEAGLKVKVINSKSEKVPLDAVFIQYPLPGKTIKVNRTGQIWVNNGESQIVPNIVGLELLEARSLLQGDNIQIEKIDYQPSNEKFNTVIGVYPKPGTKLEINQKISILVSSQKIVDPSTMPNLIGLDLNDSKVLLEQIGLSLGKTSYSEDSTLPVNTVMSTNPAPGEKINKGQSISLVINRGVQAKKTGPSVEEIINETNKNIENNEIENIINETLNKIEQRDNVKNNQGGQNDAGESNTGN